MRSSNNNNSRKTSKLSSMCKRIKLSLKQSQLKVRKMHWKYSMALRNLKIKPQEMEIPSQAIVESTEEYKQIMFSVWHTLRLEEELRKVKIELLRKKEKHLDKLHNLYLNIRDQSKMIYGIETIENSQFKRKHTMITQYS